MPTAQSYRRQAALEEMRRRSMQRRNRQAVAMGVGWEPRNPATLMERLGFNKPSYGKGATVLYNF